MEFRTFTTPRCNSTSTTAPTFKMAVPQRGGISVCLHPVNHLAAYGSKKPVRILFDLDTTATEFRTSILASFGVAQSYADQLFVVDWLEEASPLNPEGGAGYSAPSSPEGGGAVVNGLPIVLWTRFARDWALHLCPDPFDGSTKYPAFARPPSLETRSLHVSMQFNYTRTVHIDHNSNC